MAIQSGIKLCLKFKSTAYHFIKSVYFVLCQISDSLRSWWWTLSCWIRHLQRQMFQDL